MKSKIKSIQDNRKKILESWLRFQAEEDCIREDLVSKDDLKAESSRLLDAILKAMNSENYNDIEAPEFEVVIETLSEISMSRAHQGYSPRETGSYVLTLKDAFVEILKGIYKNDIETFYEEVLKVNKLLDRLSIVTFELYIKGRENVISRQREEITEVSTPVIKVWDGILALPIIGTLDSARTQEVMEDLLNEIVHTGSRIAILDISGVPAVDSLVAQHLLKTVSATRLMGAECIISGIKPEIAQTMVHLGINLMDIVTKATLASALDYALSLSNLSIIKKSPH